MSSELYPEDHEQKLKAGLCIGALGVVFGDIGTSPLYTMRECLRALPTNGDPQADILGVLSLIFWTISLVVCFKYVMNIMRADNRGEGGIFTLLALSGLKNGWTKGKGGLCGGVLLALFAAALLFGESSITPAITVLSAVEGLKGFDIFLSTNWCIAISLVVLLVLFFVQRKGTHAIGKVFGPVMLVWFAVLGGIGLYHIIGNPVVIKALNPGYGIRLLLTGLPPGGVTMLCGSVVLAVTGVEALYADMGHFGRKAIAAAWYYFVMPGLLLNYFGQGAYVLGHPGAENPFFELLPVGIWQGGLSLFAIVAAVIASQAVITGAYSVTSSAIHLGFFPRLKILHTNPEVPGQIYVPIVNFAMLAFSLGIVILFRTSTSLAAAYGVAVTGAMIVTTVLYYFVLVNRRHWTPSKALALCGAFWLMDWFLFVSAMHKFMDVGWIALLVSLFMFIIMHTWKSGRMAVEKAISSATLESMSVDFLIKDPKLVRVSGCGVFMSSSGKGIPLVLIHHVKANKCIQKTAVILTIVTTEEPYVIDEERLQVVDQGSGLWRVHCSYGYMEQPDAEKICHGIKKAGVPLALPATTFFFNREIVIHGDKSHLYEWQAELYAFLSRNAQPMRDYYSILPNQVIEVGLPVKI